MLKTHKIILSSLFIHFALILLIVGVMHILLGYGGSWVYTFMNLFFGMFLTEFFIGSIVWQWMIYIILIVYFLITTVGIIIKNDLDAHLVRWNVVFGLLYLVPFTISILSIFLGQSIMP